jgi:DNA polymerase-3 subunit chi
MTVAVEFHILEGSDLRALDHTICARIAQCVSDGHTVCVVTDSLASAERVDTALWTFSDQSFVPHDLADRADARTGQPPLPSVVITTGRCVPADILVNLAPTVPEGFESFHRIMEFVDADPTRRDAGRRRFVAYRDRGHPPQTHKVGS